MPSSGGLKSILLHDEEGQDEEIEERLREMREFAKRVVGHTNKGAGKVSEHDALHKFNLEQEDELTGWRWGGGESEPADILNYPRSRKDSSRAWSMRREERRRDKASRPLMCFLVIQSAETTSMDFRTMVTEVDIRSSDDMSGPESIQAFGLRINWRLQLMSDSHKI
ncbi:hypothetical protein D9756_006439 [Leucocoprinus leucothites]|uniref:Uncharacterized protein n=1 Tax=Leucocoprinus leucothites TaxID=201217 RepID=A0A8H5G2P4_9AGAR|nr:hypothetical protein D9756_006439 [Leucoagaricus leucothites]